MKHFLSTALLSFFIVAGINAQVLEVTDVLTPVPANSKSFQEEARRLFKSYRDLRPEKIKLETYVDIVELAGNKKGIVLTVQTSNNQIYFETLDHKMAAQINIYGRIAAKDETQDLFFKELKLIEIADAKQMILLNRDPVIFRKVFELKNGKYQIGITLQDSVGDTGIKVTKFQIK